MLFTVCGVIGFAAASVLLVEKVALLEDPSYVPSCSINPILSCGSIMRTEQAEVFGFPNPMIGIAGFAMVTTTGVAVLAGAAMRHWYWRGLQAGVTFGVVFVHWLAFQSLHRIGALCPYCMVVWAVTIPLFWYTTLYNLRSGRLPTPRPLRRPVAVLTEYHGVVLTV
ncbi:MAG: vitamin K epoxide reductase family protein [Acidimicrobiales bacterium]|nr:vitamin K epoxide reductase family protein [Acidimicrobiales bacterium]